MKRGATRVAIVLAALLALSACGSRVGNTSPKKSNPDPVGVGGAYQKANNALP